MGDLVAKWKSHGDYAAGYADAFNGNDFDASGSDTEPYQVGWDAGTRAANMFADAGFSANGDGMAISFKIHGDPE